MSLSVPDIPARARVGRGWFHPGRWRFWCFSLPVLFWVMFAILFWWPGLSYNWKMGKWFMLQRSQTNEVLVPHTPTFPTTYIWRETARLRIGPVEIEKMQSLPPSMKLRGFVQLSEPTVSIFAYGWDSGYLALFFHKG